MSRHEMVDKILEFAISQGGHIGFKEVLICDNGYIKELSIFSKGDTNYYYANTLYKCKLREYSPYILENILLLISQNKFL